MNSRLKGDHKNITLVDLDGFAPLPKQIKGSTVQAWSAEGPGGKGHSKNWAKEHIMFHAAHATNRWSLHFSLVNTAATNRDGAWLVGCCHLISDLDGSGHYPSEQKTH